MRHGISRTLRWMAPGAVLFLAACSGEYPQTMLRPVTEYGRIQSDLWATVTWWTVGIMMVVFGALAYILVRFRARPGDPRPKPVYGSTGLELAWTIGPAVIILFIAIPTIQAIFETQAEEPADALVIEAIGHQWWWEFRYPAEGITTANQFYMPAGRPVALRLRSADVIHSFWIPRLGGKKDVNPVVRTPEGVQPLHLNTIVFRPDSSGEFLGQCAEYCGTSHAIMRMLGRVVDAEDFGRWVDDIRTPVEPAGELAQRGRDIFMRSTCIACHTIEGTTARGQLGPNLTHFGDRFSIGAGLMENTQDNLAEWILRAPELKDGVLMPGARSGAGGMPPTGLSREDARAVAAYLVDLRRPLAGARPAAAPADTLDAAAPADTLNAPAPADTLNAPAAAPR
ncbi:MAG TPA: cytochrome c oxidase subunit II [Longimicrobiales bacterium]|nr:cytochrome c oxidase subunit II [Longimicrobiales bacterium]